MQASEGKPNGVLVYLRTAEGNDALAWVDKNGNSVTESQFAILKAAECSARHAARCHGRRTITTSSEKASS